MLGRRAFLQRLSIAAAGAAFSPVALGERQIAWRNWSGSQTCLPAARLAPATVAELQELVASSALPLRPVGAGHSFTALVPTQGNIVTLARLSGMTSHDPETLQATFLAGTTLSAVGAPLHEVGQAMINMPDIDEQVLAGALSTCTHGTGASIGAMPTFVSGLDMVLANGEEVHCSPGENSELFRAAQVSLGALGIISRVTLQNTRPYRLRRESWIEDWETTLDQAQERADKHRNFEFYYVPFSDRCFVHTHDLSDEASHATPLHDQNEAVGDLKKIRDYLGWSDTLRAIPIQLMGALIDREVAVEASWLSYASERNVRFNEMEYHLPRENGLDALREVRRVLESGHREVFFPIEVRFVKGDDIWLSPFQGRDCMSIAVHRYYAEDYQPYFASIEPVFRKYGGRPHWGKLNSLRADDFAELYPHWNEWLAVREAVDPAGKFLNPYLRSVFGVTA